MPKAKLSTSVLTPLQNIFYVWEGGNEVIAETPFAGNNYIGISYPVADDWVES